MPPWPGSHPPPSHRHHLDARLPWHEAEARAHQSVNAVRFGRSRLSICVVPPATAAAVTEAATAHRVCRQEAPRPQPQPGPLGHSAEFLFLEA